VSELIAPHSLVFQTTRAVKGALRSGGIVSSQAVRSASLRNGEVDCLIAVTVINKFYPDSTFTLSRRCSKHSHRAGRE
jgi:hypothetical protein